MPSQTNDRRHHHIFRPSLPSNHTHTHTLLPNNQAHERLPYREGVTLDMPATPAASPPTNDGGGCLVNVGLRKDVRLDRRLKPGVRVTVKLDPRHDPPSRGVAVAPSAPREEAGLYWGYTTRVAKNLAEVFAGCPFKVRARVLIGSGWGLGRKPYVRLRRRQAGRVP
jgi:predicted SPOUT superfamily RNA methylase MTH1